MGKIRIFIVLALLSLAAVFSVTQIRFSANIYDLLPSDLTEVRGMDALNRHFSRDSQLIVTIEAPDPVRAEAAAASLADYLTNRDDLVSEVFRELPVEDLAGQGGGLLAWLWLNAEPEAVEELAGRLRKGNSAAVIAESLETIESGIIDEEIFLRSYDPLGLVRIPSGLRSLTGNESDPLASTDGTFRVMYVEGAGREFSDYRAVSEWLAEIRKVTTSWQAKWVEENGGGGPVKVSLTGTPAFMAEIGTAMEKDMSGSVVLTTVLIALLFWMMHRRLQPLLWLISMMLLILCLTLNLGGLLFGELSVMSAGFAAILMGLTVDYGVVLYREAQSAAGDAGRLRRTVGASVFWAATTTAVVFLSLNLSSLPGIAELGNLVAIGIAIGAVAMLSGFARLAVRFPAPVSLQATTASRTPGWKVPATIAVAVPLLALISLTLEGMPRLEPEFRPFRIESSPAVQAWEHMESRMQQGRKSAPLIVTGASYPDLRANLEETETRLKEVAAKDLIRDFYLPQSLVPDPSHQRTNAAVLRELLEERDRLLAEMDAAGFSAEGTKLTSRIFERWKELLSSLSSKAPAQPVLPSGELAGWTFDRLVSSHASEIAILGSVAFETLPDRSWIGAVSSDHTFVASLGSLGSALNERIRGDLVRVFLPMMGILALMLAIVFRSWRDLVLSLFCLGFSAAALILLTVWTPLGWNSFNVCGIPLLFGAGLDYAIHTIFALRRNGGDLLRAREGIGKALIFCGCSTAIGFGSLAFSSARGLASLGQVCAAGIFINMIVAVWLLPRWWRWLYGIHARS